PLFPRRRSSVLRAEQHALPSADKLWEAATRAELSEVEIPETPEPRAPVRSLTADEWPALTSGELLDRKWSAQGALWLLVKGSKGLSWCSLQGSRAKCTSVEGAPRFHDAAPLNFARNAEEPILAGSSFSEASGLS